MRIVIRLYSTLQIWCKIDLTETPLARWGMASAYYWGNLYAQHIPRRVAPATCILLRLCSWICLSCCWQTSRGTVTGLVTDSQKAAVPVPTLTSRAHATNVTRSTQTNDSGLYRFDAVDPGHIYSLQVKTTGFRTFVARAVRRGAAQVCQRGCALELGEVQQVVEVSADAVQIQTESPVAPRISSTKQIDELPLASRNPYMLALTAPGVTTNKFTTPSATFSVNGGRGRSNNFMVDGTDNNDISVAGQAVNCESRYSIQEVNVQAANYDAEFGRAGGAVVNVYHALGK